jgi:hypothetical protein
MFSSRVIEYDEGEFLERGFEHAIAEMKRNGNPGYHVIATNLELNTNPRSYYHYSAQTVEYSASGELLQQYLTMETPRLFVYGDRNSGLSYLPQLAAAGLHMRRIPDSDHFVFYDNPYTLYKAMAEFIGIPEAEQ